MDEPAGERLPALHRALLRLHRRLLSLFPSRFPRPWAEDAYETTRLLVELSRTRSGSAVAAATAVAECWTVLWLGVTHRGWLEPIARLGDDVRVGLRRLRGRPLRAALAVLTLAVGVGASTSIFGVVNQTFLRPLALSEVDRLVRIDDVRTDGSQAVNVSPFNASRLLAGVTTLSDVVAQDYRPFVMTGRGDPERLQGAGVSSGFGPALGVAPMLGRWFTTNGGHAGDRPVPALISHALWTRSFAARADVLGTPIVLNGRSHAVVGVLPAGFHFPYEADVWVPIDFDPAVADAHHLLVLGRLAAGRTLEEVRNELAALSVALRAAAPEANRGIELVAVPLRGNLVRGYDKVSLALLSVVGFLVLLGAVNVACLGLADARGRAREMAIRSVMGATRARQVVQVLTESTTVALLGGVVGVGMVLLLRPLLARLLPPVMTHELALTDIAFDVRVLGFAVGTTFVSALVAGLLPAFGSVARDPAGTLRGGGVPGRRRGSAAGLAVVGLELAMGMVLVVGAGAVTTTFLRTQTGAPGYDPTNVLTLRASLPGSRYPGREDRVAAVTRMREGLAATPGVLEAAIATGNPEVGGWSHWATDGGDPTRPMYVEAHFVTPGFLETLRIPVVAGRGLAAEDDTADPVALVSRSVARRLWGDEERALGGTLRMPRARAEDGDWTVVGVVEDVRDEGPLSATVYLPYARHDPRPPAQEISLFVRRGHGDPLDLVPSIREVVRGVDADLALHDVLRQEDVRRADATLQETGALLAAALGGFGVLLCGFGVFGIVSGLSAQATRGLGVRKALGAGTARLVGVALFPTVRSVVAGLVLGAVGAWWTSRLTASLVPGLPAPAPSHYAAAALLLGLVALGAALPPLMRAARVEIIHVLNAD